MQNLVLGGSEAGKCIAWTQAGPISVDMAAVRERRRERVQGKGLGVLLGDLETVEGGQ